MSGHACSASSSCNNFWQGCGLLEGWIDADEANEVSGKYALQLQITAQFALSSMYLLCKWFVLNHKLSPVIQREYQGLTSKLLLRIE